MENKFKVRRADWVKRTVTISVMLGNVAELIIVDMQGHPMTLAGMYAAMDDETRQLAIADITSGFTVFKENYLC